LDGAREGGAEAEKVNLTELRVQRCTACFKCRTTHVCPLQDDVDGLAQRIAAADALVVAAPVYWSNIPSSLMALHERLTGYLVHLDSPLSPPKARQGRGRRVVFIMSCTAIFPFSALLGITGGALRALRTFWQAAGFTAAGRILETGTWREGRPRPRLLGQARRVGLSLAPPVRSVHSREFVATPAQVGALLDGLASEHDRLWPRETWPPMVLDRPLGVGATGGHGPIRYVVDDYEAGRRVRFRFLAPEGFTGTHAFDAAEVRPGLVRLRHTIAMRVSGAGRVLWPLAIRPLHDALVEDLLDQAEAQVGGQPRNACQWSAWVRFLRGIFRRRALAAARKASGALRTNTPSAR
jgi:hypothetical protein